jgi:hypothetical protein
MLEKLFANAFRSQYIVHMGFDFENVNLYFKLSSKKIKLRSDTSYVEPLTPPTY